MEDLLASVKAWLQALAPRERYMVLGGAAACLVIVLFAAWLPVERRVSHLEDSVHTKQADLAWLQSVAPQLVALRNAPPITGGQSLVALVDQVARQTGVVRSLTGSQPGDDGTLSVRLEQVPFDALISWPASWCSTMGCAWCRRTSTAPPRSAWSARPSCCAVPRVGWRPAARLK